jgi:hypothetical protein
MNPFWGALALVIVFAGGALVTAMAQGFHGIADVLKQLIPVGTLVLVSSCHSR